MKILKRILFSIFGLVLFLGSVAAYVYLSYIKVWVPTENVQIESGQISLAGTLYLPEGEGPFPAVVILHGSSPDPKESIPVVVMANEFAERGIAALVYDKRGSGASGGTYLWDDYKGFISDIHAALDYLKTRGDIMGDALGYVGNSESGFFMPQVTTERDDLAFGYARVGPADNLTEVAVFQRRNILRDNGFSEEAIDEILDLTRDYYAFWVRAYEDPAYYIEARGEFQRRLDEVNKKYQQVFVNLEPRIQGNYVPSIVERRAFSRGYDPYPFLIKESDVPLFYVFGAEDEFLSTQRSVEILEEVKTRTNRDITYHVYESDNHSMIKWNRVFVGFYPAGYFDRVVSWAWQKIEEKQAKNS